MALGRVEQKAGLAVCGMRNLLQQNSVGNLLLSRGVLGIRTVRCVTVCTDDATIKFGLLPKETL